MECSIVKKIEREHNENESFFNERLFKIAEKDKQAILKNLKTTADDFDKKVLKIMQRLGYSNT